MNSKILYKILRSLCYVFAWPNNPKDGQSTASLTSSECKQRHLFQGIISNLSNRIPLYKSIHTQLELVSIKTVKCLINKNCLICGFYVINARKNWYNSYDMSTLPGCNNTDSVNPTVWLQGGKSRTVSSVRDRTLVR